MKIFDKALREYLGPIRYYVLGSILVVFSQYLVALPLQSQYPFLLNLTQALWALMVALSVLKLVKDYDFAMKHVLVLGVLYSFIIHGLKITIRYLFYGKTGWYLIDRFTYGTFLVMVIVLLLGPMLIYLREKKLLDEL